MHLILFIIIIFIAFRIIFAIFPLLSILPIHKKRNHICIQKNLENLRKSASVEGKAKSFIALMKLSYVTVHVMGNQGGKYSDKKQMERFKLSLTAQAIKNLKSLGE